MSDVKLFLLSKGYSYLKLIVTTVVLYNKIWFTVNFKVILKDKRFWRYSVREEKNVFFLCSLCLFLKIWHELWRNLKGRFDENQLKEYLENCNMIN